jgi:hypothetical protein
MSKLPNVAIVLAACCASRQPYGIRFEEKVPGQWVANWAFAIKESAAKKEGYDRGAINGAFGFDPAYPGCPACRASSFFQCGCGGRGCWDGESLRVTCPWCHMTDEIARDRWITSLDIRHDR